MSQEHAVVSTWDCPVVTLADLPSGAGIREVIAPFAALTKEERLALNLALRGIDGPEDSWVGDAIAFLEVASAEAEPPRQGTYGWYEDATKACDLGRGTQAVKTALEMFGKVAV